MLENGLAGAPHVRRFGIISGEFERQIRFDARAEVKRAAVEQRPSPVRPLQAAQIDRDLRLEGRVDLAQEVLQDDVFGGDGGVGLELEHPVSVRALQLEQSSRCGPNAAL